MVVVDDATRKSTTKTRDDEEKTARDKCGVFLAVAIIFLGTTRGGEKVVTEERKREEERFGDANDAEKAAKTRATVEDKDKIGGKCGLPYDLHAEYAGAVVGTWGENNE